MTELTMTQRVPLTQTEDGVFRVTGTRVTLDSIVRQFKGGGTAEQIQEDFPSVTLTDVYSVIAHYLQHPHSVDQYLREQARAAEEVRRSVEENFATGELRERLKQRRAHEVP